MSAYKRDGMSLEGYEGRILAALCAQNGGELRIKGELIDTAHQIGTLTKGWDARKQELVIRADLTFVEVWKIMPEKQVEKEVVEVDPLKRGAEQPTLFPQTASTLDDDKLQKLERELNKRRVARMVAEDLRARQRQPEA